MELENEYIEYKKSISELDDAMIDIAAMLNKHNRAIVYFGISNDLKPVKNQIGKDCFKKIESKIYSSIDPKIIPMVEIVKIQEIDVIKVEIDGENKVYSAFGKYYIRIGEVSRQLSSDELAKLFFIKNYSMWEKNKSLDTLNDVDEESLKLFLVRAIASKRAPSFKYDKNKILNWLGLVYSDGIHLNNAGSLLFSNNKPISLQLGVYATDERLKLIDMSFVQGNIFNLLEKALQFVKDRIYWRAEIKGFLRKDIPEVPIDALREIIINSFAHASYINNSHHSISLTPSMIDIYNPGSFPNGLCPEDYAVKKIKSNLRNELICSVLYKCQYIESWGSGFKKVYSLCNKEHVKIDYKKDYDGFWFSFYRPTKFDPTTLISSELDVKENTIFKYIVENPSISQSELAIKTGYSRSKVNRILLFLKKKGYIKYTGSKKIGKWEIIKK